MTKSIEAADKFMGELLKNQLNIDQFKNQSRNAMMRNKLNYSQEDLVKQSSTA